MSKDGPIITLSGSPASSVPSSASQSSAFSVTPEYIRDDRKLLGGNPEDWRHQNKWARSCKERTLDSELCRLINKYMSSMLSDDKCRRMTAIAIMVLAVFGLYHVLIFVL